MPTGIVGRNKRAHKTGAYIIEETRKIITGMISQKKAVTGMDHVINSLQEWLDIFKESEPDNKRAHEVIEKAIDELYKYYSVKN